MSELPEKDLKRSGTVWVVFYNKLPWFVTDLPERVETSARSELIVVRQDVRNGYNLPDEISFFKTSNCL